MNFRSLIYLVNNFKWWIDIFKFLKRKYLNLSKIYYVTPWMSYLCNKKIYSAAGYKLDLDQFFIRLYGVYFFLWNWHKKIMVSSIHAHMQTGFFFLFFNLSLSAKVVHITNDAFKRFFFFLCTYALCIFEMTEF